MTNYYELLKVPRNAGPQEITSSYRYLLQHAYQEQGREAELSSLSQAHKTLTNPAKRQEYDRKLNVMAGQYQLKNPGLPTEAEKAYLEGLKSFERQNYQEAVQYFAKASRLEPAQGHFYSQWGLAIGMFPGRLPEAELYCKKAIEQDPDNPEFYYNLGFLYQRHNLGEAAQQSFARAQEAQSLRQAKLGAQEGAPIAIPWEGDADSLLVELEDLEQAVGNVASENAAGPDAVEAVVAPETPVLPEQDTQDLLKELESLETSIKGTETIEPAPEEAAVSPGMPPEETATAPEITNEAIKLGAPPEEVENRDAEAEAAPEGSATMDLLKELDSIESMVNGTHDLPAEEESSVQVEPHPAEAGLAPASDLEPALVEMESAKQEMTEPHPLELHEEKTQENSADDLEQEALNLLRELNVPLDEHLDALPEPITPDPETAEGIIEPQATEPGREMMGGQPVGEAVQLGSTQPGSADEDTDELKRKLERLSQMEEQMMEELLKLKAEREKLKSNLKI